MMIMIMIIIIIAVVLMIVMISDGARFEVLLKIKLF